MTQRFGDDPQSIPGGRVIAKAIIKTYTAGTHKADVQLVGSHPTVLSAVRVATNIPAADVVVGRQCTVLFLDPANQDDAVVLTTQGAVPSTPGGGGGAPSPHGEANHSGDVIPAADQDFGGFKARNLGAPLVTTDATRVAEIDAERTAHAALADPHTVYGALAQAETWAALQTFSAGVKLAAAQAIYDSTGVARITVDAATPNVLISLDDGKALNIDTAGLIMAFSQFTDGAGTYQQIEGQGSGGAAAIQFGRILGGTSYSLYFSSTTTRFGGTLEVRYATAGVILSVASIGATAGGAIDSSPLSAELDLTATAAQTGKVWAALKTRLTHRGTFLVPDANAIDAKVTRENTSTAGGQTVRGALSGWVNNAALPTLSTISFYGYDTLPASGSVSLSSVSDAAAFRARDQGAKGGRNIHAYLGDAITGGTNRYGYKQGTVVGGTIAYLLELGAGPTMRLKDRGTGGWTPAAGETPLWIEEGATPTFRQVKSFDPGAGGGNFVGGERVLIAA